MTEVIKTQNIGITADAQKMIDGLKQANKFVDEFRAKQILQMAGVSVMGPRTARDAFEIALYNTTALSTRRTR